MKKISLFFVSLLAVMSCGSKVCTIKGSFTDPVDSVSLVNTTGDVIDNCILADGSFTLKCEIDPKTFVCLMRGNSGSPIPLIPDVKEINLSIEEGKPVISGSPLSTELQEFQNWVIDAFMENNAKALPLIDAGDQEAADALSDNMHKKIAARSKEVYLNHKSDALGLQAMFIMMEDIDADEFIALYEQADKFIQADGKIGGYYEHLKAISLNEVVTYLENGEIKKEAGTFEDYVGKGKYALVDFWASWCGPCREETPNVVAAYEKYKDKGLIVIGVPVNDKVDATIKALESLGIHYPQILDPSQQLADRFSISTIPHIILFGPDGTIVADNLRGAGIATALQKNL